MAKKQRFTTEQKVLIITELACYTPPSKIQKMLLERWQLTVNASTIVYYDPYSDGSELAKKWKKLFDETRARFIARCGRVPIRQKEFRWQKMQDILEIEEERKNTVGMRETIELAEKVDGGALTNKRELTGKDGGPLLPTELVIRFVRPEPKPSQTPANGNGG